MQYICRQCATKLGQKISDRRSKFGTCSSCGETNMPLYKETQASKGRALLDVFTTTQLEEIYYALETKVKMIKNGDYGPEDKRGEDKRWIEDLEEIMGRISGEVDV